MMRENYSIVMIECNKKNSEFFFLFFSFFLSCVKGLLPKTIIYPNASSSWSLAYTFGHYYCDSSRQRKGSPGGLIAISIFIELIRKQGFVSNRNSSPVLSDWKLLTDFFFICQLYGNNKGGWNTFITLSGFRTLAFYIALMNKVDHIVKSACVQQKLDLLGYYDI